MKNEWMYSRLVTTKMFFFSHPEEFFFILSLRGWVLRTHGSNASITGTSTVANALVGKVVIKTKDPYNYNNEAGYSYYPRPS